jgi:hypothetical protein
MKENGQRKNEAGRPKKVSDCATLPDLGITRDQSSQWQQLAEIPEQEFEASLQNGQPPREDYAGAIAGPWMMV